MWIFLFLFFAVSAGFTVLSLSLSENNKILVAGAVVIASITLCYYPFTIRVTNLTLASLLGQPNVVSSVALIQIFESILLLTLAVFIVKDHYNIKSTTKHIIAYLNLLPSFVFLIGLFFLQSYLFLHIEGISYLLMALLFGLIVFLGLVVGGVLTKFLVNEWDLRAEFKMLTSLFQILLAMFLPLIVKGINVPFTNLTIEVAPVAITGIIISSISLLGGLYYYRKEQLKAKKLKE